MEELKKLDNDSKLAIEETKEFGKRTKQEIEKRRDEIIQEIRTMIDEKARKIREEFGFE